MSIEPISFYAATDGDRWDLGRELGTGRLYVLYRPARPDAVMVDYELEEFLARFAGTPQHEELLRQAALVGEEVG